MAAGLFTTASAFASETPDPLSGARDPMLCYRRDYSAEHLALHPRQTTTSILLAWQEHGLIDVVLTPRTGPPRRIAAGCGWTPSGAGIDTSGRRMIPDFTGSAAYECIVTVGSSSAEGGYLLVAPAPDKTSLTVFLQSPVTTDDVQYGTGEAYNLKLGPDDVTFKLSRIDAKPCARFKAKRD